MSATSTTPTPEAQPLTPAGEQIAGIAPRRTGAGLLGLALLLLLTTYALQAGVDYPAILIDSAALAHGLAAQGGGAALLGFPGLALCGGLVIAITRLLAPALTTAGPRRTSGAGLVAGAAWVGGGLLGLGLLAVWHGASEPGVLGVGLGLLGLVEIVAPLALALWTAGLSRAAGAYRGLAWVSIAGLVLGAMRGLVWLINALLPVEVGFYGSAGVLNLLAVVGQSLWIIWLALAGIRLLRTRPATGHGSPPLVAIPARRILRWSGRLGGGLIVAVLVLARTVLLALATPPAVDAGPPGEPALLDTLMAMVVTLYTGYLNPMHTVADMRAASEAPTTPQPLPAGVTVTVVDAAGVPAQQICASGATMRRVILYLHGGGFAARANDQHHAFAAELSATTGACVLLPDYRLAPEHPFPAGLDDCVTAYGWLRSQGVAPGAILVAGESAGGNLTLALALALKQAGATLPAALVAISAPTDLTMTGPTYASKAAVDPLLGSGLPQDAFAAYTNHGAVDPRDPRVSPLFADLYGLPPTLLQVGTQEVLLSDSQRLAARMQAAGVPVQLEVWPGMWHAFTLVSASVPIPGPVLATRHIVDFTERYLSK